MYTLHGKKSLGWVKTPLFMTKKNVRKDEERGNYS